MIKTLNGKELSEDFVKMLIDEDGKILHTVTKKTLDEKDKKYEYYLDGKLLDIKYENRINFLENGSVLVNEFNPPEGKDNFVSLDGKILFKGNNDDHHIYTHGIFLGTRIKDSEAGNSYYIDPSGELIKIVKGKHGLYFINKENKNLIYDTVCEDDNIVFYHDGQRISDVIDAKQWYFPQTRHIGLDTYLNINGESYLLNDNDVGEYKNITSRDGDSFEYTKDCTLNILNRIKVENNTIIKIDNDITNKNIEEYVPKVVKLIDKNVYINVSDRRNVTLFIDNKKYNYYSRGGIMTMLSDNGDIIIYYMDDNNEDIIITLNGKEVYRGNREGFDKRIKTLFNGQEYGIQELDKDNTEFVNISDYKKLLNLNVNNSIEKGNGNIKQTEVKKSNIYQKLDSKLEIIFKKIDKKSFKSQLSIYKKLKDKINKLQSKYTKGKQKELIDYLYEKFNNKYKEVFVKYVKSKKSK